MSCWSHVSGVIRLNSFRRRGNAPDFDEMFGREVNWVDLHCDGEQEYDRHPEKYLPMGSEGSLQKSVWVNPDHRDLCAFCVTIFGDLRDHYNSDGIIEWFKKKCESVEQFNCCVRSAFVLVENDVDGTKTWTYNPVNKD